MLEHMSVQNITIRLISGPTSTAKTPSDQRVLPPGKASPTDEAFMPAGVCMYDEMAIEMLFAQKGFATPFEIQKQFICNPEHPDTDFNPVGRTDGLIVLATGENALSQTLETSLVESGLMKSAIALGGRQFEIGVTVEAIAPINPLENHNLVREAVWPVVVQAGNKMENLAKVSSSDAIIVVPSGTVAPHTDTVRGQLPAGSEQKPSIAYLLKNTVRQSWSDILITLGSQLEICQFLSFEDWLYLVLKSDPKCGPGQNPVLQLEEFFREDFRRIACGLVIMATDEARKRSGTLRMVDAVFDDVVASYFQHWRTSGCLLKHDLILLIY
ncbi:NRPS-like enzyme [Penicillium pulvis]|uniref:NRPS-like enzyme n=1 Tax=Penicillium pulvis TaxID=1562058 RepID=UPI002548CC27|nr:NRPS-like enzyme [Penicillium pulvis]KAJ5785859.1 NRPS-like enzyme [Penicillium pulvis]